MASDAAKARMRTEVVRGLEYVARETGSETQVEEFLSHVNQPTYGDFEMRDIFTMQAALKLFAESAGVDLKEVDLSDEGQIKGLWVGGGDSSTERGHKLVEDPKASDEIDPVSDEDYEESLSESDVRLRERNEEAAEADAEASEEPDTRVIREEGEEDEVEEASPTAEDSEDK